MSTPIERPFIFGKNKWMLLIMVFFSFVGRVSSGLPQKSSLEELELFFNKCIRTTNPSICKIALQRSEVLQRQAAAKGNYACQSRLLGLGSDLLMISFNKGRDESVFSSLKEVELLCEKSR